MPGLKPAHALAACTFTLFTHSTADAGWRGDFESNDLGQWSYLLNEGGLSVAGGRGVATDTVREGTHSGQIAIDGTQLWSNGLNRVELQRKPEAALSAEGSEVYFGWSLYLPTALSSDEHQIGYWESDESYKQVMSLHAKGQDLSFNTNLPGYKLHWTGLGRLTPGTWHRVVYRVLWSQAAEMGRVSLCFDGEWVVDQVSARTFVDNPAFIQVGILRDTIDQTEVMFIDDAREGATLAEVEDPTITPQPAAPAASSTATAGAGVSSAAPTPSAPAPSAPATTSQGSKSSSCAVPAGGSRPGVEGLLLLVASCLGLRRLRSQRR